MSEEFCPVAGWEGLYEVSNCGTVRATSQQARGNPSCGRVLKTHHDRDGYVRVNLRTTLFYVHRLVASAFIPNTENKPQVNHMDGCKPNNCANNLEWSTQQENMDHAVGLGLMAKQRGEFGGNSKLTAGEVLAIRSAYERGGISMAQIAPQYSVSESCINSVVNRRTWKHLDSPAQERSDENAS